MTPLLPGASEQPDRTTQMAPTRAGAGRAWQREMERAQAATWFHAGLPAAQAVPLAQPGAASPLPLEAGEPRPDRQASQTPPQDSSSWRERPVRDSEAPQAGSAIHPPSATRVDADIGAGPAVATVRGAVTHSPLLGRPFLSFVAGAPVPPASQCATPICIFQPALATVRAPVAAAAARAIAPEPAAPPPSAPPGPRIHVEEGPAGLQVWLGIDGDEAQVAARAASILAELRRAPAFAGQRLASVVCNGATVYALAAPTPASQRQEP